MKIFDLASEHTLEAYLVRGVDPSPFKVPVVFYLDDSALHGTSSCSDAVDVVRVAPFDELEGLCQSCWFEAAFPAAADQVLDAAWRLMELEDDLDFDFYTESSASQELYAVEFFSAQLEKVPAVGVEVWRAQMVAAVAAERERLVSIVRTDEYRQDLAVKLAQQESDDTALSRARRRSLLACNVPLDRMCRVEGSNPESMYASVVRVVGESSLPFPKRPHRDLGPDEDFAAYVAEVRSEHVKGVLGEYFDESEAVVGRGFRYQLAIVRYVYVRSSTAGLISPFVVRTKGDMVMISAPRVVVDKLRCAGAVVGAVPRPSDSVVEAMCDLWDPRSELLSKITKLRDAARVTAR